MSLSQYFKKFAKALPAVVVAGATLLPGAAAAAWPERPITIVVGYPAGSITDLLARRVGNHIGKELGQSVVVENRSGGGGIIGAEYTKKAAADGYTLMVVPPSYVFSPVFRPHTPFNPVEDFTSVAMLATTTMALYVGKDVPASNLKEYIEYSKTLKGGISLGNTGNGSASHISAELLKMTTDVELTVIPYRGGAPAANDLLGGTLPSLVYDIGSMLPHFKEGTVKAIGMTGLKRHPLMPEVPTLAEQGAEGFDLDIWFGLVGPKGMPADRIETLNRLAIEALATSEAKEWMESRGLIASDASAAEVDEFFRKEIEKWTEFNKVAKITIE